MARNKNQSQTGLNDNRQENLDDNRRNVMNRESLDDLQRGNAKKNKQPRKGNSGKDNH